MMPDMGQIEEAIEVIKELHGRAYKSKPSRQWQAYGIVLSILSHVKEHGLSLTEEEILDIIFNYFQDSVNPKHMKELAKSIVDKQKGKP